MISSRLLNTIAAPFRAIARSAREVLQEGRRAPSTHARARNAGFTLLEIVFAVEVMLLLSLMSFNETKRMTEHARVAACLRYSAVIQRTLWGDFAFAGEFPADLVATLDRLPSGIMAQSYVYAPLGGGAGGGADQFYMRCEHNHSYVGVLFNDVGAYLPPKPIYALAAARGAQP